MQDIVDRINEKIGWNNKPKGWNLRSMRKFAATLTDKDPTEHAWFDSCTTKMSKHLDKPEAYCASLRDSLLKTTMWRGKGKDIKAEVEKNKK